MDLVDMPESWIELGKIDDLPPGRGRTCVAGSRRIAVFNDGGEYLAIDDTCPHLGGSLGSGAFYEGRVICPLHAWVFDLRTGECPRGSHEPVRVYRTRSADGAIHVQVSPEASGPE